jgi:phospholipid-binding lipoprotein MlaA
MNFPTVPALRAAALASAALLLAGCATTGERRPGDPLEPVNRGVYEVNDGLDKVALKPVATVYDDNVPKVVKTSVGNFFTNLGYPVTIVNQLLQGKVKEAGQDTLRFALNTTLGLGGLFDPASDADLPKHDEDFGQTLGKWGVPAGPYLMLPLLGPSNMRDLPSHVFNRFLEPFYWYNYGVERWFSLAVDTVDKRASLLPLDDTLARAYDPYAFLRDAYQQRRLYQVYDGDIPEDVLRRYRLDEPLEDPLDDPLEDPLDTPSAGEPDVSTPDSGPDGPAAAEAAPTDAPSPRQSD